jgi:excinuclease ABC subunit A
VVVDRFKVRDDIGLRLAESFETALEPDRRHSPSSWTWTASFPTISFLGALRLPRVRLQHQRTGAAPVLLQQPRRRLPGLRRPRRAPVLRPGAHRPVPGSESLAEGAIRGWDRRNVYYFPPADIPGRALRLRHRHALQEAAEETPHIILHGSGDEEISFSYVNDRGDVFQRRHHFEGVLPNMERRYRETESQSVREDLAKFLSTAPCSDCGGSRLCEDARHVLVDDATCRRSPHCP